MSTSTWLHIVAMSTALLLVLPFGMCMRQSTTGGHQAVYAVFTVLVTIGMGSGLVTPFRLATAVHSLAGFGVYLGLLAVYMAGSAASLVQAKDPNAPPPPRAGDAESARVHVWAARALLFAALPFQVLTGVVAALELADERRSGPAEAAAATIAAAALLAVGVGYTIMSAYVARTTSRLVLARSYRVLAAENAAVFVLGVGGALATVYFDVASLPHGRAAIARLVAAVAVAAAGAIGYMLVHRRAAAGLLVPRALVLGAPAIVAAATTLGFAVFAAPRRLEALGSYLGIGAALAVAAATATLCARLARALSIMPVPLGVLAACVFAAQRGCERLYVESHVDDDGTLTGACILWTVVGLLGAGAGAVVATRCGMALRSDVGEQSSARRLSSRRRAAARNMSAESYAGADVDDQIAALLDDDVDVDFAPRI